MRWQLKLKTFWIAWSILLGLVLLPVPSALAQPGAIIVAVDINTVPFVAEAANGLVVGYEVDLMDAIARTSGLSIVYRKTTFPYLVSGVATHLYDVALACIFITEARKEWVDFTEPHFTTGIVLVVHQDNPSIKSSQDLKAGVTVGVRAGTTAEDYIRTQTAATVLPSDAQYDLLGRVAAGTLDAVVMDELDAITYIYSNPSARLKVVGGLLSFDQCAMIANKEETELLVRMNGALERLKNNGKFAAIYRRWFGDRALPDEMLAQRPEPLRQQAPATIPPASPAVTQTTTLTSTLAGTYSLTLATEPVSQQIVTLTAEGVWVERPPVSEVITSTVLSNTVQGIWRSDADNQIQATVLAPHPSTEANVAAGALRKHYQMTIADDGAVTGSVLLEEYDAGTDPLSPTASPVLTQTVEFTGQRVQ